MIKRVRMTLTKQCYVGLQPFCYRAGQVYNLPPVLAKEYLARGWAIEDKSLDIVETKEAKPRKRRKKKAV
jgi:hypothetical protein